MSTPTVTVTATLNDPSGSPLQGNSFLRFRLRNYQGFAVQVSTYALITELQYDAMPTSGGSISQTIIPNNDILPSTTFYTVEAWNQGRILWSANYLFNGNTNLNTAAQLNAPPVPPGFLLVLENNGALNSSQSTLNLESTDGSVTITDVGGGTLNFTGAGASAGSNVLNLPDMPVVGSATGGLNGYTVFMKIPATRVGATSKNGLRVGIWTAGITGLVVNRSSVGATLPNSNVWTTAPVAFTWPVGSFSAINTLYLSNAANLVVDTAHDYWIAVYFDPSSSSGSAYADLTTIPQNTQWYAVAHYLNTDHTSDSDASSMATSILGQQLIVCFGQVVTV